MKKLYIYFLIASMLVQLSACRDEVDVDNLMNFPPTILSVTPKTGVKTGDFDIKVILVDGISSPLNTATVTLKDADGNELASVTKTLSGVKDSVLIEGSSFNAESLPLGDYSISIVAKDSKNQESTQVSSFKIVNQLYLANFERMFIAGGFNGWSASELELVADNTWEIKNIDLQGGPWKLKNTEDWSDQDWGDTNCDGTMEPKGSNGDTNCDFSGAVNVRFNDETLKYTVLPAVNYATNLDGLYLLGTFNDFTGPQPQFKLVADYTWEVAEIRMQAGDAFRFSEGATFEGKNYGDNNLDGKAEEYGANIKLDNSYKDAYYKITFNDATRLYTITVVRYPFPSELYLVGGSTSISWEPGNSIPFRKTADGKFEIFAYLKVISGDGNGFKLLQTKDWPGDWGKGDEGKLLQEGEANITVAEDGFYRIMVDFTTGSYTITKTNWGVVGFARTGTDAGWNADTNMTFDGDWDSYTWRVTTHLYAGEYKFRANGTWAINFGDNGRDGKLELDAGTNMIIASEGDYVVEMILDPVNGYTYTVTPQ
ncbi:hypothetical protein ACFQ21_01680 [Ohtaekwangia kribbensis]|jgi:hypothetical protein|uniref:SusE outer membrane protein domain-containing protein n=1 Tax=Ohtaekwangia kribbensis TaxID=688913 RepID=A0ABW3JWQ8_9BACT